METKLAKMRQRIAELEANPPTPQQTLEWLQATEEDYIDRRNSFAADTSLSREERTEYDEMITPYLAEIRKHISKLEPARTKRQKFPLEPMRCYAGGEGKQESSLRAIRTVKDNNVRYAEFQAVTGESIGLGECHVRQFLAWALRPATKNEMSSLHHRPKSLAEQKKARKESLVRWFTNEEFLKRLSKVIVLNSFRNGPLEDIHAGTRPSSKTGDYSDVKVVSPFGEIPWTKLSRISQEEMKELMIYAVNHVFSILHELVNGPNFERIFTALVVYSANPHWNEPELDPACVPILREKVGHDPFVTAFFTGGSVDPLA
jgi:hypothetical protein